MRKRKGVGKAPSDCCCETFGGSLLVLLGVVRGLCIQMYTIVCQLGQQYQKGVVRSYFSWFLVGGGVKLRFIAVGEEQRGSSCTLYRSAADFQNKIFTLFFALFP